MAKNIPFRLPLPLFYTVSPILLISVYFPSSAPSNIPKQLPCQIRIRTVILLDLCNCQNDERTYIFTRNILMQNDKHINTQ